MSYNEKFTRPVTETVEEFTDPSLVTVPSHVLIMSPAGNQLLPNQTLTHLKQTSSVDSLASSTVNVITSIREEMQVCDHFIHIRFTYLFMMLLLLFVLFRI